MPEVTLPLKVAKAKKPLKLPRMASYRLSSKSEFMLLTLGKGIFVVTSNGVSGVKPELKEPSATHANYIV